MLYEIPQIKHIAPSSVEEVVEVLERFGDRAKIVAGGTDLLGLLKDGVVGPAFPVPEVLVSIRNVPGMREIGYGGNVGGDPLDELIIGAGVTLSDLEESPTIRERYAPLAQAAGSVATLQIRNVGTVGGNLCQRPWCWYFRHPAFPCFKKGGKLCYAITGEHTYYFSTLGLGTCVMSHPSDLAPALVALGGSLRIAGPRGTRDVPIQSFFNGPKEVADNILKPDEVLLQVNVSGEFEHTQGAFLKDRVRGAWDLSLASCAVLLKTTTPDGVCVDARLALGGLAPYPYRAEDAEECLRGDVVNEQTATRAAERAMANAKSLPMTKYKIQLGQAIIKRAIMAAAAVPTIK